MAEAREYISLNKAARYSGCYSQEYLSLRARHGKLKATKFGRNWVTTEEWLNEYLERVNNYKNNKKNNKKSRVTDRNLLHSFSSLINYLQPVRKLRLITVTYVLVFLLLSAGVIFGYPYLKLDLNPVRDFVSNTANQISGNISKGVNSVSGFTENTSNKLAIDIWDLSDNVFTNIRQFAFDTSQDINNASRNLISGAERTVKLSQNIFIESGKGIKSFSEDLKFGLAFLKEGVNEDLVLPFINFFSFLRSRPQQEMTFGEYVKNDIQNLKEFVKKITKAIAYPFVKSYQYVTRTILTILGKIPEKIADIFKREGLVVIPSSEKDEEIAQKIKASFSDEIRVEPKDESSGIITPIFREREGEKYLYILVPMQE